MNDTCEYRLLGVPKREMLETNERHATHSCYVIGISVSILRNIPPSTLHYVRRT